MKNKKIIYEDKFIIVKTTGQDYDFIAIIENKTNNVIEIEIKEKSNKICVKANDWQGILANDEGYSILETFKNGNIVVYKLEKNKI